MGGASIPSPLTHQREKMLNCNLYQDCLQIAGSDKISPSPSFHQNLCLTFGRTKTSLKTCASAFWEFYLAFCSPEQETVELLQLFAEFPGGGVGLDVCLVALLCVRRSCRHPSTQIQMTFIQYPVLVAGGKVSQSGSDHRSLHAGLVILVFTSHNPHSAIIISLSTPQTYKPLKLILALID